MTWHDIMTLWRHGSQAMLGNHYSLNNPSISNWKFFSQRFALIKKKEKVKGLIMVHKCVTNYFSPLCWKKTTSKYVLGGSLLNMKYMFRVNKAYLLNQLSQAVFMCLFDEKLSQLCHPYWWGLWKRNFNRVWVSIYMGLSWSEFEAVYIFKRMFVLSGLGMSFSYSS